MGLGDAVHGQNNSQIHPRDTIIFFDWSNPKLSDGHDRKQQHQPISVPA
jgi:hypothetical protein